MNILRHHYQPGFTLFGKRYCYFQEAQKPEEDVNTVDVAPGYNDQKEAEGTIDKISQKANARVDKLGSQEVTGKMKLQGILIAFKNEALEKLKNIDKSSDKDKEKERARVVNEYRKKIAGYIGTPQGSRKIKAKVVDENGNTTGEEITHEIKINAKAVNSSPGIDVIKSDPVKELKENEQDLSGERLTEYLTLLNKDIDWDGMGSVTEDYGKLVAAITSALADNVGRGYLNYQEPNADSYIYVPLTRWVLDQIDSGDTTGADVQKALAIISSGKEKIVADTDSFRQEVASFKASMMEIDSALELNLPINDEVFKKPPYEITLTYKKGFEAKKGPRVQFFREWFEARKSELAGTIKNSTQKLQPRADLAPELEAERRDLQMQIGFKEAALAGIAVSGQGSIDEVSMRAKQLATLNGEVSSITTKINQYMNKVDPSNANNPPSAESGGSAAPSTNAPKDNSEAPKENTPNADIQVKGWKLIAADKGKDAPPKDQYEEITELTQVELDKMPKFVEAANKAAPKHRKGWYEAEVALQQGDEVYLTSFYYKNYDANAKNNVLSVKIHKAKRKKPVANA